MKPKLLFLSKLFGYSLGLFVLWRPLSKVYGFLLDRLLRNFYPLYDALLKNDEFPYLTSLGLIPLIALVLATPRIKVIRKAGIIAIGIAVFLLLDFSVIQFDIREELVAAGAVGSLSYEVYRLLKWLLPFLLWVVFSHRYLSEYSKPTTD